MDATANYKVFKDTNETEFIIDFLESQEKSGSIESVEWNAYRYKNIKDQTGRVAIMMFGISLRAYGSQVAVFFKSLKSVRNKYISSLTNYPMPGSLNVTNCK